MSGRRSARPRPRLGREAVGVVVLVVLALICAGLIAAVAAKTRADADRAAAEAAAYTPPPISEPATRSGPLVAIVGDGSVTTSAAARSSSASWPALLQDGVDGQVRATALPGAGYVTDGASGRSFVDAAADVPDDADVVLFVGGAADASRTRLAVATAATQAYSAASRAAPKARIVVVGPLVRGAVTEARMDVLRSVLRRSAQIARATFADPIAVGWLGSAASTGTSGDVFTGAQKRTIANRLEAVLRTATDG